MVKPTRDIPKESEQESDDLTIAYMCGVSRGKELAQRTWVGLTEAELREIIDETGFGILMNVWFDKHDGNPKKVLQAIELKLKEKNT